jgi:GT2 family glycosyltransferase
MLPIYIIILNYKKWQDTQECLESVFHSSYKDFSVIVIDNDSQNNSLEHLMQWVDNTAVNDESSSSCPLNYTFLRKEDITDSISLASFPRLIFIQNNINAGFGGGINVCVVIKPGYGCDGDYLS